MKQIKLTHSHGVTVVNVHPTFIQLHGAYGLVYIDKENIKELAEAAK